MLSFFDDEVTETSLRTIPNSPDLVFDIETGFAWHPGDSIDAAKAYCQPLGIDYDPASIGEHPGEFDSSTVKVGNLKDEKKIAAKIAEARDKHAQSVSLHEAKAIGGEQAFWESIIDNAALSPVTGRVLAIGFVREEEIIIDDGTPSADADLEESILENFWELFAEIRSDGNKMVGWNIANFDVPFLVLRSAKLGVEIPCSVYRGKWLSDTFVDLMDRWGRGFDPWKQSSGFTKAKHAARFLGCERPEDEIEGKDFWRYFLGSEADRAKAIRYLENDVVEETVIAKALGVI